MNQKELIKLLPQLGKHFLRVIKKHGLYLQFRALPNDLSQKMNKFIQSSIKDYKQHQYNGDDNFALITCVINNMLHYYLEEQMHMNPQNIAPIGADIFQSFCTEIFGDEATQKELKSSNPHQGEINQLIDLLRRYEELSRNNPSDKRAKDMIKRIQREINSKMINNNEQDLMFPFFQEDLDESEVVFQNDDNEEDDGWIESNIFYRGLNNCSIESV